MDNQSDFYHVPALLEETIHGLSIRPGGVYVDVTFGGGGHSKEILKHLNPNGRLYAFDQDEDAEKNIVEDKRFVFVRSNFRFLYNFMKYHGVKSIDGLLADLGVSSHHFDDADRGFSFRFDGALDMRMNKRAGTSAAELLNTLPEEKLADIFYLYGEMKNSRKIASLIVKARQTKKIVTIGDFLEVIRPCISKTQEKKDLAKVFQALRIEVNQELETLKEMLEQARELLKPGGRLAVITYHSLEDRLVKNYFKTGNFEGKLEQDFFGNTVSPLKPVSNKVIVPSDEEVERNPRARSAKLRIAEKL
ncbi:16S rRNA (cytosine(1402)-N(4))-methyltransferase RsmH [Parabacteroides sp. FAFU027]|uniref:16S rRNA (cytosine(1402)-N(4))-methyltransferase RsmH n=1 Tax=Parabacteroides sp. FAFU027 TaxID=2922715 RepID=UPI001FB009EB|nr:16S rRNA (cytosine(1402)-N(4))-methyltransferase RsmH [Parabacteroides sp. FAFU027]